MALYTKDEILNGQLLLVDKPLHWTSFQAVNAIKWDIRKKFDLKKIKIGHAGTLDPLASGLLLICVGKFTKKINEFQGLPKEYKGIITLGSTTPSYDLETEIDKTFSTNHITKEKVLDTLSEFTGVITQKPPIFSALKKDGKRLYEYARKGEQIEIKSRNVEVFEFEIIGFQLPNIEFRILCSKGTYIRSIAHDFGKALNSGAHLSALRRTKIGDYNVNIAMTPKAIKEKL
ncbi:tRNA pseudouridine(55) synthase TruB [Eudoraea sp.]|uniref:tRNA pseudouridine(55) synthase TruB n=1 Tax=Eudoraea sp. TaxID=1979955 RepID=UPI003C737075